MTLMQGERPPTDYQRSMFHPDIEISIGGFYRGKGKTTVGIILEWFFKRMGWEVMRWEENIPSQTQMMHFREAKDFRESDLQGLEPRKLLIRVWNADRSV